MGTMKNSNAAGQQGSTDFRRCLSTPTVEKGLAKRTYCHTTPGTYASPRAERGSNVAAGDKCVGVPDSEQNSLRA